jgi:radical SAM superfamily enzyme YgiQ (UPF0313 family)
MVSAAPSVRARVCPRRIALVSVGAYIAAYGVRKMAPATRVLVPDTKLYFVLTGTQLHSVKNVLLTSKEGAKVLSDADIERIATELATYDLIGFSSMTVDSDWTKKIIRAVRAKNPKTYIVWGGMHPIVRPEECLEDADAVCTGEGDYAFDELLERMLADQDWHDVRNFWFKRDGEVIRNGFRPLLTPAEMAARPHPQYADGKEFILEPEKGFQPLVLRHYLALNGLSYHTIWTQGCPYRCSYCGNTAFLAIDKKYATIRQTPVDYIIGEVKAAVAMHPHINTVVFDDDCMAALPIPVLKEFSEKWRKEVGVPFFVAGVIPSFVNREKLEILLEAGMNRMRMGIQSGSDKMLKFFKRPNKPGLIRSVTGVISDYRRYMILPAYDIIVDIPVETREDVVDTIRLVYDMPRPFTLSVFGLRLIPGTDLEKTINAQIAAGELDIEGIDKNYRSVAPTMANALIYLTASVRPPRWLFEYLLKYAKPAHEKQTEVPLFMGFCRGMMYIKRGLSHVRFMDFSVLPGRLGYWLWKIGLVRFWQKHFVRKFHISRDRQGARPNEIAMPAPRTFSVGDESAPPV